MFATGTLAALLVVLWAIPWIRVALETSQPSRSLGTRADGSLEHGRPMPPSGRGFVTYSRLGATLGRQYLHADARDALLASFRASAQREPGRVHVVAETGWPRGGRFRPHRTHRNGLSADVLMPMRDARSRPARLSTTPWTKFGYAHELDATGRIGSGRRALKADFDALAAWLLDLEAASRERGLRIERVIIAPEYVPLVLATPSGQRLGALAPLLSRKPSWIRHDEHVHVDFVGFADFALPAH